MNFKAHFDFKTNPPKVSFDSKIENIYIQNGSGTLYNPPQTSNTISTKTGRLAMYSDGKTIWDSTHSIMQNGEGLYGNRCNLGTHNSVFVPIDLDSNIYYYFTTANTIMDGCYFGQPNRDSTIYYHIIDLRLNDGKGAVVSKNNKLSSFFSDNVVAVKHRNGVDTWVATRDKNGSACVAWLLTPCGLGPPVISKTLGYCNKLVNSQFQFSPNGRFAAFNTYRDILPYLDTARYMLDPNFSFDFKLQYPAISILEFNDSTGVFKEKKKYPFDWAPSILFVSHPVGDTYF